MLLFRALFAKCILAAWFSSSGECFRQFYTSLHRYINLHLCWYTIDFSLPSQPLLIKNLLYQLPTTTSNSLQIASVSLLTFGFALFFLLFCPSFYHLNEMIIIIPKIILVLMTGRQTNSYNSYNSYKSNTIGESWVGLFVFNEIQNTRRFPVLWKIK